MKKMVLCSLLTGLLLGGCGKKESVTPADPTTGSAAWTGTLVHDYAGDLKQYTFADKADVRFAAGYEPTRLADGSTLYINKAYSGSRLEVINAAGNQIRVVFDSKVSSSILGPRVSPDGTKIAFTYIGYYFQAPITFGYGTVVVDMSGNYVAGIANYFSPSWLPDGRLLLAGDYDSGISHSAPTTPSAKAGLYLATLAGGTITPTRLAGVSTNPTPILPSASPDGSRIAFVQNNHLWLVNPDGSGLRQLTNASNSQEGPATWSPDGKYVATWCYKTFEITYYSAIAVVPTTGTTPVMLENDADVWPRRPDGGRISGGWGLMSWR
ncbi:hypothetical protein GCM10027594_33010 [Hymenobacter agri]